MTLAKRPPKAATTKKKAPKRRAAKRRKPNPYLAWRKRLDRTRPGLVGFTLDSLAELYGHPPYARRWIRPPS